MREAGAHKTSDGTTVMHRANTNTMKELRASQNCAQRASTYVHTMKK